MFARACHDAHVDDIHSVVGHYKRSAGKVSVVYEFHHVVFQNFGGQQRQTILEYQTVTNIQIKKKRKSHNNNYFVTRRYYIVFTRFFFLIVGILIINYRFF